MLKFKTQFSLNFFHIENYASLLSFRYHVRYTVIFFSKISPRRYCWVEFSFWNASTEHYCKMQSHLWRHATLLQLVKLVVVFLMDFPKRPSRQEYDPQHSKTMNKTLWGIWEYCKWLTITLITPARSQIYETVDASHPLLCWGRWRYVAQLFRPYYSVPTVYLYLSVKPTSWTYNFFQISGHSQT